MPPKYQPEYKPIDKTLQSTQESSFSHLATLQEEKAKAVL